METERDPLRKIPTKHAPEPKADIGGALRAAREKRGHTLEAVSQQTRISRRYLEALEKNRFDEFPALAYLRGFLKSYCDYLELDFEPLWRVATSEEEHPQEPPAETPSPSSAPAPAAARKSPQPAQPKPKETPRSAAPAPATKRDAGPALAVFALCLLTIGSAVWLVRKPRQTVERPPSLPAALAPLRAGAQARVVLQFRDDVWISVASDGKTLFEGRAPKASRQEWPAVKGLSLKAVNPDAIQATVNGAPVKLSHPDAHGVYHIETP